MEQVHSSCLLKSYQLLIIAPITVKRLKSIFTISLKSENYLDFEFDDRE